MKAVSFAGMAQSSTWTPPDETVEKIKERKYQCFIEDHEPSRGRRGGALAMRGAGCI